MRHFIFFFSLVILSSCHDSARFLQKPNEQVMLNVLREEIPDLPIENVHVISSGGDNEIVEINGEWIFRFPRSEEFVAVHKREGILLDRLRSHIDLQIPKYEYIGKNTAFVGYRKIKGQNVDAALYETLTPDLQKEMAATLARFLQQLHQAIPIEEAHQIRFGNYQTPLKEIKWSKPLPQEVLQLIQEAREEAALHPAGDKDLVLIHNDMHGDNFVFDVSSNKITGVFDFSDAAVADYATEFSRLFNVHPQLAYQTAEIYAELTGRENPIHRAAVDYILRRANIIAEAEAAHDTKRESKYLNQLEKFIPVWTALQHE